MASLITIAFFVSVSLASGVAEAGPRSSERDATREEWRRVEARLLALGYSGVSDVDVVGSRFVADATSAGGSDVDVVLDRRTLRILHVKRD
jgi:hypothetical protein